MYLTIEDLVLPDAETLRIKASLYIRESATEIVKFEAEAKEMIDLIDIPGTWSSAPQGLTATDDYYGKTADYYADTAWPVTT